MAKALALLSLLLLFNGCLGLGKQWQQSRQQNQCQLNQIQAREPDNRIESEAGLTESWNPNDEQFQCAGVAMVRRTIEPNGLHLPSFVNAPQLIYIIKGRGVLGAVFPGCPETFEESQEQQQFQPSRRQGGQRQQQMGQQSEDQQDRHQKIRHVRQGDVIALPAGVAYWSYNNGNEPLIAVSVLDLSNPLNQLDQQPRRFYLAGNPQSEFEQGQQGQRRQQYQHGQQGQQGQWGQRGQQSQRGQQEQWRQQGQQGQRGQQEQWGQQGQQGQRQQGQRGQQGQRQMRRGQQQQGNTNIFSGFDPQLLAQAFNVDEETARNLQGMNDDRNEIVRVQGPLEFMSPGQDVEQQRRRQGGGGGGWDNGLEETMCTMRLRQNIGDPKESDFYNPQAGRITVLNSNDLPILRYLRLNAERGVLYNNAIYTPHWNLNSNEMVYVIKGNAQVQVVNDQGEAILDEEVQEGQVFLVPQNHAAIKQAGNQGFEYISFRTEDQAMMNTMAGRTSVLRALPDQVLSNAFQISEDQARMLKYNRMESRVLSGQSSSRGQWSII